MSHSRDRRALNADKWVDLINNPLRKEPNGLCFSSARVIHYDSDLLTLAPPPRNPFVSISFAALIFISQAQAFGP